MIKFLNNLYMEENAIDTIYENPTANVIFNGEKVKPFLQDLE